MLVYVASDIASTRYAIKNKIQTHNNGTGRINYFNDVVRKRLNECDDAIPDK